jgi:UDP-N-acetylmuramate--alanine ligase
MDFYGTMDRLRESFVSFMNSVPFYGLAVLCGDDPLLTMLSHRVSRRKTTYGFGPDNHYRITSYQADEKGSVLEIQIGKERHELRLQVPGRHNALNAVAALAVADELSIPRAKTFRGLSSFQGVQRRFQKRGERNGVLFVDDYAHHPREIAATLAAARERFPKAKIRVVFQPHRYTRVEDLFNEFSTCFRDCDGVAVTDIYSAGEAPIPGVTSALLAENIRRNGQEVALHVSKPMEGIEAWLGASAPGDVIFTLGAGDLPGVYKQLF